MKLILVFALVALVATVFSAPSPNKDHHAIEAGPFGVEKDGGIEEFHTSDHSRSKRWGGWGWGRPYGMGWGRPWGMGWGRPWGMGMGMGGWGGYGGYGWGR
uniref:Cuticular protein n=1 Tax=Caenorhabditis tropicalis TaxID=1561998 RepID=A0A1I7UMA0_9PELO